MFLYIHLSPKLSNPMDGNPPGSSVHGILQARILDWVAIPFYSRSSLPRDQTQVSSIAGGFFTSWATREARMYANPCPTLCNPIDCSPPCSSVHGILQPRILEWVAIPFSRGSSQPRDQTQVSCIVSRFFNIWATRDAIILPKMLFNIGPIVEERFIA